MKMVGTLFFLCARECIEKDLDIKILPKSIQREGLNSVMKYAIRRDKGVYEIKGYEYNGKMFGYTYICSYIGYSLASDKIVHPDCLIKYRRGIPDNSYVIHSDGLEYRVRLLDAASKIVVMDPTGKSFFSMLADHRIEHDSFTRILSDLYYISSHSFLRIEKDMLRYKSNGITKTYTEGQLTAYSSDDTYLRYNKHGQLIESIGREEGRIHITRYHGNSTLHVKSSFVYVLMQTITFQTYSSDGEPNDPIDYEINDDETTIYYGFSAYSEKTGAWNVAQRFM